jgi:hypothetical protein
MEAQLIRALQAEPELARRGCTIVADTSSGVVISRPGRNRGVWAWLDGAFTYTPHGFTEPTVEVETVAEAVQYTLNVICTD